ncbi:1-(5-phosphoribosyl)-5-[(5-phosphoribosylamino)methylideneamino]imidazole-4-carboxamide isomerase [Aceticella autotrophica]|uniref:1-(5-phosphoribosyl)-5-[(5-phosphoribosylamino)methylideneamino] imidazole-4-carboxamide isomerase n=1 Tax=Aceticella autotrophica TaxID=2755338 RepID=A0A975AV47_9THEO|nr:1-(5-phosphoribosyl)-5-[(5-phosphoribosylamino)methylideneamino]imidazole-4-carboxamide isomerase [Aceticella autotrophica]QSZ27021.1 1-(5-phosphoribosyl)-5-[(5-phosphoribosylamino)methylideneamino]imidazole-4-carboxamide isomerase [Aceticella autotrophica]
MIIIPAIDIIDGKCVRLTKGDYDTTTVYYEDPSDAAKMWYDLGATRIHVVDLEGAKEGHIINIKAIEKIRNSCDAEIEVGGGIRDIKTVELLRTIGIDYLILGSIAVYDRDLVSELIMKYKEKIIIGIDSKDGNVAAKGWIEKSGIKDLDLALDMKKLGVKTIIFTDISKDGMLQGPNYEALKSILKSGLNVIASGGITTVEDIIKLKNMDVYGAILGKALYTGKLNLKDALEAV